jgi:class 3 adenylate cyclase/tetratricopeptide (TPR) repeat protein
MDPERAIERKVITALFCDVVGSTELAERLDPEDVDRLMRTYHSLARRRVESHGGSGEKFIGDAVVGVFGAPAVHEDDPSRAFHAALSIVRDLEASNLGLQVRIGIQTGEAVVAVGGDRRPEEGYATGDILNTAARLQGVATPGAIAVGDPTYRMTRAEFEWADLGQVAVKGKAQPVQVWRPIHEVASEEAPTATEATPFLGREAELDRTLRAFEDATAARRIELVTILAEPGMGKSRLVRELGRRVLAKDGVKWHKGRCLPYGDGISFWALGEIVKSHAGILETDDQATLVAKLDAAIAEPDVNVQAWVRDCLAPLVGLRTDVVAPRQEDLFSAWTRYLTSIASAGPAVVVIEDLHWADPALVEFLIRLADATDAVPLLLVVTARPEVADRHPTWLTRASRSSVVQLVSLDDSSIRTLLERSLAGASEALIATVLERAAGSPLYAEQLAALARERRLADPEATLDESVIPATVQALLTARIDALPHDLKSALLDASVIGRIFWSGAVATLAGVEAPVVVPALEALVERALTRTQDPSTMLDEAEYQFWHALLRDVAYSFLPRLARLEKHRMAAAWITERSAGAADQAEIVADHLRRALDLAMVLGAQDDEPQIRADLAASLLAASERTATIEPARAIAQIRAALDLLDPKDPRRAPALARQGTALHARYEMPQAVEAFEAARAAYAELGDEMAATSLVFRYVAALLDAGQDAKAQAALEEARPIFEANPGPGLVDLRIEQAIRGARVDDPDGTARAADDALQLAASLGLPRPYRAAMYRAIGLMGMTGRDADPEFRAALDETIAAGDTRLGLEALVERAQSMEGDDALAAIEEAAAFAARYGLPDDRADWSRVEHLSFVGRWDEALERVQSVLQRSEAKGDEATRFGMLWFRVWIDLERTGGQVDTEGLKAKAIGLGLGEHFTSALAVKVALLRGDLAGARNAVSEALERTPAGETVPAIILVEAALAAGDLPLARLVLTRSYPESMHRAKGVHTRIARALVLEAEGDFPEARPQFEASVTWLRPRTKSVPLRIALSGLGRTLVALGEPEQAMAAFREARSIAETLKTSYAIPALDAAIAAAEAAATAS